MTQTNEARGEHAAVHAVPPLNVSGASIFLRAVGNPVRLQVLQLLDENDEMSVGSLMQRLDSDISQSALSQHLTLLRAHGLVTYRRASQTLYYRIADTRVTALLAALRALQEHAQ
ncbi:MAG: hypothetical protein KER_03035 [Kerstersia gyiorum]